MSRHLTRAQRPNATKIMVVYSKATGERRRVIDADSDDEYQWHIDNLHPGEGCYFHTINHYDTIGDGHALNDYCAKQAGFPAAPDPSTTRHAVVSPLGIVVNVIHADPTCGDLGEHIAPGHALVQHPLAGPGWTVVQGIFIQPVSEIAVQKGGVALSPAG